MEAACGNVPSTSSGTKGRPEPVIDGDLGGEHRVLRWHMTLQTAWLTVEDFACPSHWRPQRQPRGNWQNHLPEVNCIMAVNKFNQEASLHRMLATDDLGPLISLKLGGIKTTPLPG